MITISSITDYYPLLFTILLPIPLFAFIIGIWGYSPGFYVLLASIGPSLSIIISHNKWEIVSLLGYCATIVKRSLEVVCVFDLLTGILLIILFIILSAFGLKNLNIPVLNGIKTKLGLFGAISNFISKVKFLQHPIFGLGLLAAAGLAIGMAPNFFTNWVTEDCGATPRSIWKSLVSILLVTFIGGILSLIFGPIFEPVAIPA